MFNNVQSAIMYARAQANLQDEPMTIYYIAADNTFAIGRIGSLMQLKRTYAGKEITKIITIDPSSWQVDTEEEV